MNVESLSKAIVRQHFLILFFLAVVIVFFFSSQLSAETSVGTDNTGRSMDQWIARLGSSGEFDAPQLAVTERTAFGIEAAKTRPLPVQNIDYTTNTIGYVFTALSVATVLIVLLIAWRLGRIRHADGTITTGFTIGSKLAMAFGSLVTLLFVVSTLASFSQYRCSRNSDEYGNIAGDACLLEDLQRNMLMVRMNVKDFLITNTDHELEQYTEYIGNVNVIFDKADADIKNPKRVGMLQQVRQNLEQYEQYFSDVVSVIDHRNGIVASQMDMTGPRVTQLLNGIITTAHDDNDLTAAVETAECLDHFTLARVNVMKFLNTNEEADARKAIDQLKQGEQKLDILQNEVDNPNRKLWLHEAEEAFAFYSQCVGELIETVDQRNELVLNNLDVIGPQIAQLGRDIIETIVEDEHALQEDIREASSCAVIQSGIASAVAVIIAVIVAAMLIRMISSSIQRVLKVLLAIAAGDLTSERLNVKTTDEMGILGRATDTMSVALSELIREVTAAAREVAGGSTEIAASSEEIAQGMNEQSQQVTQISSAIEEMAASIVEVAKKSAEASTNAMDAGKIAEEGGDVVEQTITGMNNISETVSASATAVQELGKRGEQIGQIIEVINDIADQTNLLALNAAIEAARAGEHGRGFAVVADEVRKLADRTTKATEEIAGSITAIQSETGHAVERMNAGTEQVSEGVKRATEAGNSLKRIVASAQGVAAMVQSIAAAAEEQSSASEQVSRNVESITAVTQEASQSGSQAAAAATQLSSKAEQLQAVVSRFRI